MNSQLHHMIAQERSTEMQRASARARLARNVGATQRSPRRSWRTTRLAVRLGLVGTGDRLRDAPATETH